MIDIQFEPRVSSLRRQCAVADLTESQPLRDVSILAIFEVWCCPCSVQLDLLCGPAERQLRGSNIGAQEYVLNFPKILLVDVLGTCLVRIIVRSSPGLDRIDSYK